MIPRSPKSKPQRELRSKCVTTGKRAYRSEEAAQRALDFAETQRGLGNIAITTVRAYECPDCHYWHTTSRPYTLPAQSAKRKWAQRQRTKMLRETFGTDPLCRRCGHPADDGHELLSRARGGSITDPDNIVPLCRTCHSWVTTNPTAAEVEGWSRSA